MAAAGTARVATGVLTGPVGTRVTTGLVRARVLGSAAVTGGVRSAAGVTVIEAEFRGAGRPSAPALTVEHLLSGSDLLAARGLVSTGGVLGAAEGLPRLLGELQAAVVTVTCVDRPVTTGLALCQRIPGAVTGRRSRARHAERKGDPDCRRGGDTGPALRETGGGTSVTRNVGHGKTLRRHLDHGPDPPPDDPYRLAYCPGRGWVWTCGRNTCPGDSTRNKRQDTSPHRKDYKTITFAVAVSVLGVRHHGPLSVLAVLPQARDGGDHQDADDDCQRHHCGNLRNDVHWIPAIDERQVVLVQRVDHQLGTDEPKDRSQPVTEVHKPVQQSVDQEVQSPQAEQRERIGGEDQEDLLGETEDGRDRIHREEHVGAADGYHERMR